MIYDDGDMKIAGDDFVQHNPPDDEQATEHLLSREKSNGNLSRARRLGAIMADDVSAIEGGHPVYDTPRMIQQRILLAFAVEIAFDTLLPNTLLSQTAQSIFYNTLRQTAPSFYEDLQGSEAYSFYYLCIRDDKSGKKVEDCVGGTYASLCGKQGDKALSKQGAELYLHFISQVKAFAESMEFVVESDA